MRGLAAGDLTRVANVTGRDEVARMGTALDAAMTNCVTPWRPSTRRPRPWPERRRRWPACPTRSQRPRRRRLRRPRPSSAAAEQVARSVQTVVAAGRADGRVDPGDRAERDEAAGSRPGGALAAATTDSVAQAGRLVGRDRQRDQGDHLDRRADQPAGPQRHHRGRPGRRGGQGLRGRRRRGQGSGPGDRPGDRGHRPAGRAIQGDTADAVEAIGEIPRSSSRSTTSRPRSPPPWRSRPPPPTRCNRSVSEAAAGGQDIAANIAGVADAARLSSQGVTEAQHTTTQRARMSEELRALVGNFKHAAQ